MATFIQQGTEEWAEARRGCVTASRVADIVAKTKSGWSTSRDNYMAELIAERLTGVTQEGYTNSAMQWGSDMEPDARAAYAFFHDADVEEAGFMVHPTIEKSGASPDGLVGTDGLVEIKCPNTATHIATLLGGSVPGKYVTQMMWQMACTGRKWCDFVSFDPRMPETARLFVKRVPRDATTIAELETEVLIFLRETEAKLRALTERYSPLKATFEQSVMGG